MLKQNRTIQILTAAVAVALWAGSANAALLAYYADGTDANIAAFTNLAAANPDFTVSNLSQVGLTNDTTTLFGGSTPAGPTAGSSSGSEWLFNRGGTVGGGNPVPAPVSTDDYFAFTVAGVGANLVDPEEVRFDIVMMTNNNTRMTTRYSLFASTDGTTFTEVGTGSIFQDTTPVGTVDTAVFDLTTLADASSYEFRIALRDQSSQNNKGTAIQGIQFEDATVIPEPASLALLGVGSLLIAGRGRPRHRGSASAGAESCGYSSVGSPVEMSRTCRG